jgi:hypothetical protein
VSRLPADLSGEQPGIWSKLSAGQIKALRIGLESFNPELDSLNNAQARGMFAPRMLSNSKKRFAS